MYLIKIGILYYLSATVNPVLYNIMSKRYRNGFKRTLCRWTFPTPSTSYRNVRSNVYNNNNNTPLSPTSPITNNIRHPRLTYSNNNNPKSEKIPNSFPRRRDNIFTFSMSKYKFVIGSRTLASHRSFSGHPRRRTSLHYRFSLVEQQERDEQQQQRLQLQLQLQQRKCSMNVNQHPKRQRAKFLFSTALPPNTPPNSSASDAKTVSNGNHSKHQVQ